MRGELIQKTCGKSKAAAAICRFVVPELASNMGKVGAGGDNGARSKLGMLGGDFEFEASKEIVSLNEAKMAIESGGLDVEVAFDTERVVVDVDKITISEQPIIDYVKSTRKLFAYPKGMENTHIFRPIYKPSASYPHLKATIHSTQIGEYLFVEHLAMYHFLAAIAHCRNSFTTGSKEIELGDVRMFLRQSSQGKQFRLRQDFPSFVIFPQPPSVPAVSSSSSSSASSSSSSSFTSIISDEPIHCRSCVDGYARNNDPLVGSWCASFSENALWVNLFRLVLWDQIFDTRLPYAMLTPDDSWPIDLIPEAFVDNDLPIFLYVFLIYLFSFLILFDFNFSPTFLPQ